MIHMKIANLFILFIIIVMLASCSDTSPKTLMYQDAFVQILFENGAHLDEVDYISIFINEDNVADNRLAYLQKALKNKYDKKVYTYKKEEVHVSGPYGKEDLDDHGIFIYLTDITIEKNATYITGEKHYTRKNHPSVEVVITF